MELSNITYFLTKTIDTKEWIEASLDIYGDDKKEIVNEFLKTFDFSNKNYDYILIKNNDNIIARAIFDRTCNDILGFIVKKDYRHKGIGDLLLKFIIELYNYDGNIHFRTVNESMATLGLKNDFIVLRKCHDDIVGRDDFLFLKAIKTKKINI